MSLSKVSIIGALALATKVAAHGVVQGIAIGADWYEGYSPSMQYDAVAPVVIGWAIPEDQDLGFVAPSSYADSDIICHKGASNAMTSATVAAGDVVTLEWTTWPTSHKGPVIDYLANCGGNCSSVDKTTLEFFKIDEAGLTSGTLNTGTWASDELIANNNSWAVTIPSTIAPGNYVLRHEIIALHSAGSVDGAQNYPQCVNLEITGSGTESPAGVLATTFYTETDPGIEINIYTTGTTYTIPGPALYDASGTSSSSGSSSSAAAVASSAADPVVASSPAIVAVASVAPATTSAGTSILVQVTSSATPSFTNAPYSNGTFVQGTHDSKPVASKKVQNLQSLKTTQTIKTLTSTQPITKQVTATPNPDSGSTPEVVYTTEYSIVTYFTTEIDIVTYFVTITDSPYAVAVVTSAPAAATTPATTTTTSEVPASTASTGSTSSSSTVATMPEGTTLTDLLTWLSALISDILAGKTTVSKRSHPRDLAKSPKLTRDEAHTGIDFQYGDFPTGTFTVSKPTGTGFYKHFSGAAKPTGSYHHKGKHGKPSGTAVYRAKATGLVAGGPKQA